MNFRLPAALALVLGIMACGIPAWAQGLDFGSDTSAWSNNGRCDDPRFVGPGMAATTVEADRLSDATDCRTAFEAGTITLLPTEDTSNPAPATPAPATKDRQLQLTLAAREVPSVVPEDETVPPLTTSEDGQDIDFGNDSSEWSYDGECDDRRFMGQGMASSLSWANSGRDATDCQTLHAAGSARLWNWDGARAATQCAAIDFGDNESEYANNGICDDPRFEGFGMNTLMAEAESLHDASDCRQLCTYGLIALRDY